MDTPRGVKLTDTNQPCGLTIDSFFLLRSLCELRRTHRSSRKRAKVGAHTQNTACVDRIKLPFAGYLAHRRVFDAMVGPGSSDPGLDIASAARVSATRNARCRRTDVPPPLFDL